jgi:ribosome biogenesis GTPase A
LINDIVNIDFTVINKFKDHQKIIYVFNKADLIVNAFNYAHIQRNVVALLNSYGIKKPTVILTSTSNNVGIRKLFEGLKSLDWSEKIYFIGKSNSGKSSVINALIRYSGSVIKPLTISGYLNTTIDVKQIKLQKHNIIDTPGFNSQNSVLSNLTELKDVGSIRTKQKIKPVTFQIHEDQGFIVDNFCFLECECKAKGSVTFYIPNKIHVHRTKIDNLYKNVRNSINQIYKVNDAKRIDHEHILESTNKYNILVEGLGLFSIKGISKILINTFVNVSVVLIENAII